MGKDNSKVMDVRVEKSEYACNAIVTLDNGKTGKGHSGTGFFSKPSEQEAIDKAIKSAKSK